MRFEDLTFGEFFFVVALAAVASTAVFAHASRSRNKHATAWGVATFLFAAVAVPIYFLNYWLKKRSKPS